MTLRSLFSFERAFPDPQPRKPYKATRVLLHTRLPVNRFSSGAEFIPARRRSAVDEFRRVGFPTPRIQADTEIGPTSCSNTNCGMRCGDIQGPHAARSEVSLYFMSLGCL